MWTAAAQVFGRSLVPMGSVRLMRGWSLDATMT